MENYLSLNSWIVGLGQPESLQQYRQLEDIGPKQRQRAGTDPRYIEFSDATLQILSSNFKPNININFKDIFPVSVTTLEFDASQRDYSYFTCEATFKYTLYNITDKRGKRLDNNPETR